MLCLSTLTSIIGSVKCEKHIQVGRLINKVLILSPMLFLCPYSSFSFALPCDVWLNFMRTYDQ